MNEQLVKFLQFLQTSAQQVIQDKAGYHAAMANSFLVALFCAAGFTVAGFVVSYVSFRKDNEVSSVVARIVAFLSLVCLIGFTVSYLQHAPLAAYPLGDVLR